MALDLASNVKAAAAKAVELGATAGLAARENATSAAAKTKESVISATSKVLEKAAEAAQKRQEAKTQHELEKLNPLFPEEFFGEGYQLPQMIRLVNGEERMDNPLCMGAVGWKQQTKQLQVINYYVQKAEESGLIFYPQKIMGAAYCADPKNPKRYILAEQYMKTLKEDQVTEIKNIARCLGATYCRVEMIEDASQRSKSGRSSSATAKAKVEGVPLSASVSQESGVSAQETSHSSILFEQSFTGGEPIAPKLCWYEHNNEIRDLIASRLSGHNTTESYRCEIIRSGTAALSKHAASSIDSTLTELGCKASATIEEEFEKENKLKSVLIIKF